MTDAVYEDPAIAVPDVLPVAHDMLSPSLRARLAQVVRLGIVALVALLVLNGCFLLARLGDGLVPKSDIAAALRTGFESGALSANPWPHSMLQGRDRYSDCITAQIAVLGGTTLLRNAVAPRLMSPEQLGHGSAQHNACLELKDYLAGIAQPVPGATYTRFWHGAASVLNAALLALPFDGYSALLLDLTLGLIAATAVCAGLVGPRLLIALAPFLVAAFVFGGQVGHAQLVSYGPANIAAWLIALVLVLERERMTDERLVRWAVAAGALEAFLDQMISVPLVAAIFLVFAGMIPHQTVPSPLRATARMGGIAAAWGFGLVGTYVVKLVLSVLLLGPGAFRDFVQQLSYRAGTVDTEIGLEAAAQASRLDVAGLAALRCFFNVGRLGYTDRPGLSCLVVGLVAIGGWATALVYWRRAARDGRGAAFFACGVGYIAAAVLVAGWFVVFPEHALRHTFTVRATLVWIVGGWGWLCAARALSGTSDTAPMRAAAA